MTLDEHIQELKFELIFNDAANENFPKELKEVNQQIVEELRFLEELKILREEIKVYSSAIDWLADRCEILDQCCNAGSGYITFKAKVWKKIALDKARSKI